MLFSTTFSAEACGLTKAAKSAEEAGNIGASARKSPNCSMEVEANEMFCLECWRS